MDSHYALPSVPALRWFASRRQSYRGQRLEVCTLKRRPAGGTGVTEPMNSDKSRDVIRQAGNRTTTYLGTRTSILGTEEHITLRDTDRLTHVLTVGPTG
jgi:hypothetical protein